MVDGKSELQEIKVSSTQSLTPLRILAKLISIIFHPIFIPVYLAVFLVRIQPYFFSGLSPLEKFIVIPRFVVIYTIFPLVSVLLLRALGFIQSIQLKTQRERIIPYIICMIYYFGHWYFLKKQAELPQYFIELTAATFFASIMGFFANIIMKVSMHAIAAGFMSAFLIHVGLTQNFNLSIYISIAIILTGMICTARFIDSDHQPVEIYLGLLIGIFALIAAVKFN
jgi:uncharacterized membrane protein (UPF0136 family)